MKVLYLEDNPDDAFLTKLQLKKTNPEMEVEVVHTIKDAFEALEKSPNAYSLVLSDLNLPDGNGMILVNHIRSEKIPSAVVVVTGHSDEETAIAALKSGADDYISKSEGYLDRLPNTLENAIERHKAFSAMQSRPLRVFYAESSDLDISLTRRHISKHATHIQMEYFTTVSDVLRRISDPELDQKYDAILLDYLFPGINALHILKMLRQERKLKVPIILITERGSEEIVLQATKLGAADYIIKTPGYLYKLPAIIENAFHVTELAREQEALKKAEERYRLLVQQSPAAIYVDAIDDTSSTLFISDQIETICGYTAQEWMEQPNLWLEAVHPEDVDFIQRKIIEHNVDFAPFRYEYRLVSKSGRIAWVRDESTIVLNDEGKPTHWQGILMDITDQKEAAEAINNRDKILQAISSAAARFLIAPWQENIELVLEELGQATKASRAFIFKNQLDEEKVLLSKMLYEWSAPGISHSIDSPEVNTVSIKTTHFARWAALMQAGKPVFATTETLNPEQIKFLRKHQVKSLICIPVFVNQTWWGFLGLDDCVTLRSWLPQEIEALRTAANILGAAIRRLEAELALQQQLQEMTIIQKITAMGTQATSVDMLLEQATEIIDNYMKPDNCGTMLFDRNTGEFIYHMSYRNPDKPEFSMINLTPQLGITGRCFTTNEPQLINNVLLDEDYVSANDNIRSELCVPLRTGDKSIGVINLESEQINGFTESDMRLVLAIADHLATAIEKIKLAESDRQRLHESETLQQATAVVSTSLDLETVLSTILSSVRKVVPYNSACIFIEDPEDKILRIAAAQGFKNNQTLIGKVYLDTPGSFDEIRKTGEPLILQDAQLDPRFLMWEGAKENSENIHGWLGLPLIARDEVIGFLTLDNKQPGAYNRDNATVAQKFAHYATEAIINAQLYQVTRKRVKELEIINTISTTMRSSIVPEVVLPALLDQILTSFGVEHGSIWLCSSDSNDVTQVAASGWFQFIRETNVKRNEGLASFLNFERPFIIQSIKSDPRASHILPQHIKEDMSLTAIPIHTSKGPAGLIFISMPQSIHLTREEINLLASIAEITGNSIQRAEYFRRTETQLKQLTSLRTIDIAISSTFDLHVKLRTIIEQVVDQLGVDAACIMRYDPDAGTYKYFEGVGFKTNDIENLTIFSHESDITNNDQRKLIVGDPKTPLDLATFLQNEGFKNYFSMPLYIKETSCGLLEVYTRQKFTPGPDWKKFFETLAGQTAIAIENSELFDNLQLSNLELHEAYNITLEGWGKALELRDQETQGHTLRVAETTKKLAEALGVSGSELVDIQRGTLLHDIGKMGVPDSILHKNGPLTDKEWEIMRKHVDYAYELLSTIDYLNKAIEIPYCHHEKWDGSGYPRKLKGEKIPLGARIFAVVDVWDALRSDRPYRKAWPEEKVLAYIKDQAGSHFDPQIVDVFLKLVDAGQV